ncbi:metallophosphoesterase [Jeotgalibaca sp. MA1X17-3]|uniref:metallophosphoesterase family protein n=1 Tax=Jeotgalibaca sp. MA1X17-3 TaxID=2908211 RepID=UPI001F17A437|nr:DNA repair exonuclease [Jeotgalibaca sp. MA1X17-3]UJF15195.1 metallophosphoesterase [Jeotgalibaca sp. MA1X17-3]
MIRFIHTADLHLDSPFKGLKRMHPHLYEKVYQSTFQSFYHIVSKAIEEEVDFLLISGDIYDEENQSVKAQAFLRDQMGRLKAAGIPVYLSHGNHDFLGRETLKLQMPDNVMIFGTEPETDVWTTKSQERIAITGFSYQTRWVKERMIQQYPNRKSDVDFHIGMLHGFLEGLESSEGVYAPFSIQELNGKQYDYWALGHIHKREILQESPPIIYSGNIQGRNPNELGEKGAYLVSLEKGRSPRLEFLPTSPIIWKEKLVSLKGVSSLQSLFARVETEIEAAAKEEQGVFLSITIEDQEELPEEVIEKIQDGDLLEGFNQDDHEPFVYLYKLKIAPKKKQVPFSYDQKMQESFEKSGQDLKEGEVFRKKLRDLFKNQIVRSRFSELEQDSLLQEEILIAAQELLFEDIFFEEEEDRS